MSNWIYNNCHIRINELDFSADLIQLNMLDFDAILGINWLSENYVHIDCTGNKVIFCCPKKEEIQFQGCMEKLGKYPIPILSATKACKAFLKGYDRYLCYVLDTNGESEDWGFTYNM